MMELPAEIQLNIIKFIIKPLNQNPLRPLNEKPLISLGLSCKFLLKIISNNDHHKHFNRSFEPLIEMIKSKVLNGHTNWIESVAFSIDSNILTSCSQYGTNRNWDLKTGKSKELKESANSEISFELKGLFGWASDSTVSPDGQIFAHYIHNTIRIFNLKTEKIDEIYAHTIILNIAFSPDSKILASCGYNHTIRIWNLYAIASNSLCYSRKCLTNKFAALIKEPNFYRKDWLHARHSPDDIETGKSKVLIGHTGAIQSIAFSPDGTMLASGSHDRTIRLWNLSEYGF